MPVSSTPKVIHREVLHLQDPDKGTDKLYVLERLAHGAKREHTYTSWGRRRPDGRGMASKEVHPAEGTKLLAEKRSKGYVNADRSILAGLPASPLTASAVWGAVEGGTASVPSSAAAPADPTAFVDRTATVQALARDGMRSKKVVGGIAPTADAFVFTVTASKAAGSYMVNMRDITCTCPAFTTKLVPCKHLNAVAMVHEAALTKAYAEASAAAVVALVAGPGPVASPGAATAAVTATAAPADGPVHLDASPVAKVFAPYAREGAEDDPLIPALDHLEWDMAHAKKIALGFARRTPTMLYGPTGSGKTAMVQAFAAWTMRGLIRVNMTVQGTVGDLIGKYEVRDGATVWTDGVVVRAAKEGRVLLIDEADHMDPSVGGALLSLMEERGTLTLKEHEGEVIEPHPDFAMFLTGNSLGLHDESGIYHGAQPMNAALLARCGVQLRVDYPAKDVEARILKARGLAGVVADRVAEASRLIRTMIQDGTVVGAWGIRQSVNFAVNAMALDSFKEGFESAACAAFTQDECKAVWEAAQRATGTEAPSRVAKKAA